MTARTRSRIACVVLILAVAMSIRVAAQQTSTVSGTITYRDGNPAVNVFVSIGGRYRYTDGAGRYLIYEVPQGKQRMFVKRGTTVVWQGDVIVRGARASLDRQLP